MLPHYRMPQILQEVILQLMVSLTILKCHYFRSTFRKSNTSVIHLAEDSDVGTPIECATAAKLTAFHQSNLGGENVLSVEKHVI